MKADEKKKEQAMQRLREAYRRDPEKMMRLLKIEQLRRGIAGKKKTPTK